jgi:hypothetical protein
METLNNTVAANSHCLEDSLKFIKGARRLHEQLVESHNLTAAEKSVIARQIVSLLYTIESGRNLPAHLRQCLIRLRIDADHRAGLTDAEGIRSPSEVWDHYERLEAAST